MNRENLDGSSKKKKKTSNKKWLKVHLVVLLLLILVAGGALLFFCNDTKKTANEEIYSEVPSINSEVVKEKVDKLEPLNILLLGVDTRPGNSGRSDALIILSLDPNGDRM